MFGFKPGEITLGTEQKAFILECMFEVTMEQLEAKIELEKKLA